MTVNNPRWYIEVISSVTPSRYWSHRWIPYRWRWRSNRIFYSFTLLQLRLIHVVYLGQNFHGETSLWHYVYRQVSAYFYQNFQLVSWYIISSHELYYYADAYDMYTNFAPNLNGRYLSSNVNITVFDQNNNSVSVPVGSEFWSRFSLFSGLER